ncbi:MAG: hypothetical protein HN531_14700, partial [Opitutae bacterium]|nr:hypothetical protein [Opitutae bacterium]
MQLTNYSFLESRRDYLSAHSGQKVHANRIATGDKLIGPGKDLGALGVDASLRTNRLQMKADRVNMQNFVTFLDVQQKTLQEVRGIYDRMNTLAHRALDPTRNGNNSASTGQHVNDGGSDRDLLNKEFGELSKQLEDILDRKMNGRLIFGGKEADFTKGLQDRNDALSTDPLKNKKDLLPQSITKDVFTTSGKITIKLAPGGADDQVFVFKGDLPSATFDKFFDPSTVNNTQLIAELKNIWEEQGLFRTGSWQTTGASDDIGTDGDFQYDTFEVEFNDCETAVKFSPHPDNIGTNFGNDLFGKNGFDGKLATNVPNTNSTKLTMIGVNMPGNSATYEITAAFKPSLPYNDILVPSTGQTFPALSFGPLDCADISSVEKAQKVLSSLDAEIENLTNSMATVAAAQGRYGSEIQHMEDMEPRYESFGSRISDTDMAREATQLAKTSLKMNLAEQVMS